MNEPRCIICRCGSPFAVSSKTAMNSSLLFSLSARNLRRIVRHASTIFAARSSGPENQFGFTVSVINRSGLPSFASAISFFRRPFAQSSHAQLRQLNFITRTKLPCCLTIVPIREHISLAPMYCCYENAPDRTGAFSFLVTCLGNTHALPCVFS